MTLIALMIAAALDGAALDPSKPLGPQISGHYAERQADGASGCEGGDTVRTLRVYILARSPHGGREENMGELSYSLGGDMDDGFVVTGQPELIPADTADGAAPAVRITGARIHSVGIYRQGISNGQTVGRHEVVVQPGADGALRLVTVASRAWRNDPETVLVEDGRLADGAALRPFDHCSPIGPVEDWPF